MRPLALLRATALLMFVVAAMPTVRAADSPISEAEQRVFLDDHLRDVRATDVLRYGFRHAGSLDTNFEDTVALTFKPQDESQRESQRESRRTVEVAYLSGDRKVVLPTLENPRANPVVLYFLEQDVREMHRRLGGSENYFRRRIRLALANQAEVRPVSVDFEGARIDATEVVVRPFVDDPMKARLKAFENKSYAFTVSDRVPGGVLRIQSRIQAPGEAGSTAESATRGPGGDGAAALLEDTLTFERRDK